MNNALKFVLGFLVYALTIAVIGFALAFGWAAREFSAPGPLGAEIFFTVERGQGLFEIADNLAAAGAVENPYIFVFGARVLRAQSELKAGEYQIAARASPREILQKMRAGDTFKRRVTVREGLTSYEIFRLLHEVNDLKPAAIPAMPEGFLLPGTYDYKLGDNWMDLIGRMHNAITKALDELWPARAADLPFATPQEAIILASIIEKETGVPSERKRIAGVFINRLKAGIPLQTDPTVIYAITQGKPQNGGEGPLGRRLLSGDLEIDSPYNTYKHPGLPPGPICNPGRDSIEAALHPEANDFLYFVADGTGGHVFAKTLEEHNENVAKWREIRRSGEQ